MPTSRRALAVLLGLAILLLSSGCGSTPVPVSSLPSVASPTPSPSLRSPSATPAPTSSPAPTSWPSATRPPDLPATATPTPPAGAPLLVVWDTTRDGNGEIYGIEPDGGRLVNLTQSPADDRAPAWRPDGRAIAFESHRDGNWEIYLLDLSSGQLTRLTDDPAYDGAPAWSPDGSQIAFESSRDGNLEIYTAAAAGWEPQRLTGDPAGDYGPAWSPDGSSIAFTSWRDGNKEIYLVPAAGGVERNLTENAADDADPAWSPDGGSLAFVSWRDVDPETGNRNADIYRLAPVDPPAGIPSVERVTDRAWPDLDPAWDAQGRLVWSGYDPGPPFETYDPYRPGRFHLYRAGDRSGEDPERLTSEDGDDRRPAPAPAMEGDWAPGLTASAGSLRDRTGLSQPAQPRPSVATAVPGTMADVVEVPTILASYGQIPILVNEWVVPSLLAWQEEVEQASGWNLLGMTLGSWRTIDNARSKKLYTFDYRFLSWHKTGRALDLALEYKVDGVDQMLVTREDLGDNVYWRMYLRTAKQDGTQGEPLKDNPWQFWWRIAPDEEPEAYHAGGKRLPVPAGYYVDVTALARRHGWERIASYAIEGDYHWQSDSNGTEYWHYERSDGLTWWDAMRQIYDAETLEAAVGWNAGLSHAQSEEMVRSKGVPTPKP